MTAADEPASAAEPEPGVWVVVREHITHPLALLVAGGGSAAEALRITTELHDSASRVFDREPLVTWHAVRWGSTGVVRADWDPATPIPQGTDALLCQAWIRRP